MKRLAIRYPLTTALAVVGLYAALFFGGALLRAPVGNERELGPDLDLIARLFWWELGLATSALAFVWLFGWFRAARLTSPLAPKSARILILPGLLVLGLVALGEVLTQTTGIRPTPEQVIIAAKTMVLVGIFEEVVFRGILLQGLESRIGTLKAVFISSIIFGLVHYTNMLSGQNPLLTHLQVLHAASIGLLMGAIVVRTNSLWPSIILHGVWNTLLALNGVRAGPLKPTTMPEASELTPSLGLIAVEVLIALAILGFWLRDQRRAGLLG
jgi:uncharacterized protein